MVDDQTADERLVEEDEDRPVVVRRPIRGEADLDITPMIDVTFLLLIFFLVCSTSAMQNAIDLPPARFGKGVNDRSAVVFTVTKGTESSAARVFLGSDRSGRELTGDRAAQDAAIAQAVQNAVFKEGLDAVLIKAEKDVRHREVARVEAAAGRALPGTSGGESGLYVAVLEID